MPNLFQLVCFENETEPTTLVKKPFRDILYVKFHSIMQDFIYVSFFHKQYEHRIVLNMKPLLGNSDFLFAFLQFLNQWNHEYFQKYVCIHIYMNIMVYIKPEEILKKNSLDFTQFHLMKTFFSIDLNSISFALKLILDKDMKTIMPQILDQQKQVLGMCFLKIFEKLSNLNLVASFGKTLKLPKTKSIFDETMHQIKERKKMFSTLTETKRGVIYPHTFHFKTPQKNAQK